MRKIILPIFLAVSLFAFSFSIASADEVPTPRLRQEIKQDLKSLKEKPSQGVRNNASPSGDRKNLCEAHTNVIKGRQIKIAEKGFVLEKRWDAISKGVQKFYTEKLVPNGKTLSNYDALVADVNTKKEALNPLIEKVKTDSANLTCDKDQAKTQFQTFKTDWETLLTGLKAYRQSVATLVRGVISVSGSVPTAIPSPTSVEVTP